MSEPRLAMLDPGIATRNLGDEIISDAAIRELRTAVPEARVYRIGTHDLGGGRSLRLMREADLLVAGGSNVLGSHVGRHRLMKTPPLPWLSRHRVLLMGVGWFRDPLPHRRLQVRAIRQLLDPHGLHSVRDSFTAAQLDSATGHRAVNTGCTTIWGLDGSTPRHHLRECDEVVVALNARRDAHVGASLIHSVTRQFERVHIWPQSPDDVSYLAGIDGAAAPNVSWVPPTLAAYRALLTDESRRVAFVGTRLHGGIEALRAARPALVVAVDHRAISMREDFGLPVVSMQAVHDNLEGLFETDSPQVRVPTGAIDRWRRSLRARLGLSEAVVGSTPTAASTP